MPFFLDRSGVAMIYQNFDLEVISPHGGDRLCARVLESPQGDCPFVDVKWPFDAEEENAMLAEIYGGLRQRRGRSSPASTIEDFGGRLFEAVFSGDIEHLFRSSLDSAFRSGKGLRVRLRLPEDSELHVRPWEFLFDTESREFLAVREHTPLVRYLPVAQPIPPITVEGPLRVLVALSAPTDHPRLDIAREWDILRHALGPSVAAGQLDLRRVPGRCTFDNLRDSLRHYGAHIFHFVGHGVPGALVLEQESGKGLEMEATHLRAAFPIGALPRLIVLNACSGAITEDVPFSGLAQGFLRQGVPAVVAMQASITDDAALIFTRYFYRDLIEIGAVDTSLTEARLRMQANGHPIEWGTPVLYMRALSGQLFQPAANPATSPAASATAQKKPKEPAAKTGTRPSRVAPALNEQKEARETQSQQGAMPLQADLAPGTRKKPRTTRVKENPPPAKPDLPPPAPAGETVPPADPGAAGQAAPREVPAEKAASPPAPAPGQAELHTVPKPGANDAMPPAEAAPEPAENLLAPKPAPKRRTPPSRREPLPEVQPTPSPVGPEEGPPTFIFEPEPTPVQPGVTHDQGWPQSFPPAREETPAQAAPPGRSRKGLLAAGLAAALAVVIGVVTLWPSADSTPSTAATPGPSMPSASGTTAAPAADPDKAPLPAPGAVPTPEPANPADPAPRIASGSGDGAKPRQDAQQKPREARPATPAARKAQPTAKPASPAPADNCNSPEISERSANCVFRDQ